MASLAEDVGFLLSRASGLVVRATNAALADEGLRVRQYSVLALAAEARAGISQRHLAESLGLDPSQVVLLVDELADSGLVERRPSPADRRAKLVATTPEGDRVRHRAAALAAAGLQEQLRGLGPDDHATLKALLQRIVVREEAAVDGAAP